MKFDKHWHRTSVLTKLRTRKKTMIDDSLTGRCSGRSPTPITYHSLLARAEQDS